MSPPVASNIDPDDVDTAPISELERPLEACGYVTVFDGQRATHQVNVADGVTTTLRSGDVVFSASVFNRKLSFDTSDPHAVSVGGNPQIVRVGDLVAVFHWDVIGLSPPVVYAPGVVLRRCDARRLDTSLYTTQPRLILLDANPGEGRRTVARGIRSRLGLEGAFIELDGEEFHGLVGYEDLAHDWRRIDDALTYARDGVLYVRNFDRMHPAHQCQILDIDLRFRFSRRTEHARVCIVGSTSRRVRSLYTEFQTSVRELLKVHTLPTLREAPALVPRIVEVTLNRLPFHAAVTADFIEALMLRLGEDLVAADVARLTELAAVRARVGDHAQLTAVHLYEAARA